MSKTKFTVIFTQDKEGKPFNFQVSGWKTDLQCAALKIKYAKGNSFIDYICALNGDRISGLIHKRIF